jgi:hypothetical protein
MYEFIVYPSLLSKAQRQAVEGYLAWKWNLQTSLATTHSYYRFSPSEQLFNNKPITTAGLILNLDPNTYVSGAGKWAEKSVNTWNVVNSPTVTLLN